jgi:hypothetical protein
MTLTFDSEHLADKLLQISGETLQRKLHFRFHRELFVLHYSVNIIFQEWFNGKK